MGTGSRRKYLLLLPPPPRWLWLCCCFLFFVNGGAAAKDFSLDFGSFSFRNLTLLGDSYLRNGVLGLTRELGVPSSSAGSVVCTFPVPFLDLETNISASFSTRFTFSVTNINPPGGSSAFGDGLAFFISPEKHNLGSPGGYLGLVNSSSGAAADFLAVEFDTRLDALFGDPNDNHVGLDVGSLVSVQTADVSSRGIDLKSGNSITAWIDYDNIHKVLKIWLSYSGFKPENPVLMASHLDLSKYFHEFMYVGFSASTEGSTELHLIQDWTFRTSGFQSLNPSRPPHNVSDNSLLTPLIPNNTDTTATPTSTPRPKHKKLLLLLTLSFGIAFFALLLVFLASISLKKSNFLNTNSFNPEFLNNPRQFSYADLKSATKGFHSTRILGYGSFGTVYKAVCPHSVFAVKRSKHTHQGMTEFLAELSIIACLRHKNLVQLQGWCTEKGELLLVYEFMPNGSLDKVLYQEPQQGIPLFIALPWPQRYNIAVGIASVLTYLHEECEQQVIHRDIKTSNIMLDANFNPRLGDFGLARLMEHNKSPVSTLTAGTMGYLAPEYLQYGKVTEKTDVFSFGVVLLEVACGRRPIEKDKSTQKMVNLVDWVWSLYGHGKLLEAADKRLNGEFIEDGMVQLLLVGLSCANPLSAERPSMRRVLQILNYEAELHLVPKRKPSLAFSSSLPYSIEDIVSDCQENTSPQKSVTRSPLYEINIS